MKLIKASLSIFLFLISLPLVEAIETFPEKKLNENGLSLEIKPSLCVLSNERQSCEDQVLILWQSNLVRDLCLYQEGNEKALHCWTQQIEGVFMHQLKTKETVRYLVKQGAEILAVQSIKVLEQFSPAKKRRRNRHPWSLF